MAIWYQDVPLIAVGKLVSRMVPIGCGMAGTTGAMLSGPAPLLLLNCHCCHSPLLPAVLPSRTNDCHVGVPPASEVRMRSVIEAYLSGTTAAVFCSAAAKFSSMFAAVRVVVDGTSYPPAGG